MTTTPDARTILVAGTASHVGKSTVAAGLCRLLADRGVAVAPFKAQNMSNNARAVPTSVQETEKSRSGNHYAGMESDGFGEVGVSQYVQARAARIPAETDHNPVLLKPRGSGESQLVINGEAVAHYAAGDYYADHWHDARDAAVAAHHRLAANHDVIIAEGAGSIAEINLQDRDLANIETARFADADILLVADIERGGVFASLVGTLELLPEDLRERVVGAVITKFRGDQSLLDPGLEKFEAMTGVPVLGVLPYDDPGLPEEDSVGLPDAGDYAVRGVEDGVPENRAITVAVPQLPRVSNFTDLEPLAAVPGVRVAYVPVTEDGAQSGLDDADAVVIPGTKNTVDDLLALQAVGFDDALREFSGPIIGLCGGYQILGERIVNADVEGTEIDGSDSAGSELVDDDGPVVVDNDGAVVEDDDGAVVVDDDGAVVEDDDGAAVEDDDGAVVDALGLLPVETVFSHKKRVIATDLVIDGAGPLTGARGTISGYEIHMGETRITGGTTGQEALQFPFSETDGATTNGAKNNGPTTNGATTDGRTGAALGAVLESKPGGETADVLGTYLHDLFANEVVLEAFVDRVYAHTDRDRPISEEDDRGSPYDRAADQLRNQVNLRALDLPSE